jgi:long-chain fatty acid transport protein
MGGASFAYDNGTAAVMNNPATLGLMGKGSRLDVALGFLGPDVTSTHLGAPIGSGGDAYYMPAIGFVRSDGKFTYGVGMFAQGGMGTEYSTSLDGRPERSELGVGRLIAPLAYKVSDDLIIGGSLDFVWAMLDMKMVMPGMRLEFSDGSDFTGKAKGTGFAGKLGFVYKASPTVTIGGTYHTETALNDLETGATGAVFNATPGKITVHDFQWPATYGLGVAVQATPRTLIAADVKRINWRDVMKNFVMTFQPAGGPPMPSMAMPQNWKNQTVFSIGVAYKATDALTLRAGANLADNPIPDDTLHYLFPAIVENHYTVGLGYDFSKVSALNFSLSHAPEVSQTNSMMGYRVEHSQTNWQLMYTHRF